MENDYIYNRLKTILVDSDYIGCRRFIFPRRTGVTTTLLKLAKELSEKYKVVFVAGSDVFKKEYSNETFDVKTSQDNFSGLNYDYYIFDNSFSTFTANPGAYDMLNRRTYIAIDTR